MSILSMVKDEIEVAAYLKRIGYEGSLEPTAETLNQLHAAQRLTVPYENLDVTLRRPMDHSTAGIFQKLVVRRRGGWCHELNRLFAALLLSLGFKVTYHNAKVWSPTGELAPDYSHLVLVVHLDERWIADVGFGARGSLEALRLDTEETQISHGDAYRVGADPDDAGRRVVYWQGAGSDVFVPIYSMALAPRRLEDFDARSAEQQTEPNWWGRRMASLATREGRVSLNHDRLIVTRGTEREEVPVSEEQLPRILRERFGIELD